MSAPQYDEMALLYDWPTALEFNRVMLRRTRAAFRRNGLRPGASVCDLACGVGTLAIGLAEAGYRTTGVDISPAMLRRARAKARRMGTTIQWRRADMRAFVLPAPVDAVTCYYDSVNHLLTRRDVLAMLRHIHGALRPNGLLCFDANTRFCFEEFWGELTHQIDHAGATQFIRGTFNARTGRAAAEVTGFVPVGRNRYRKFAERVDEQYYPAHVWRSLLARAGFERVRMEAFDPWHHGGPKRMKWFVTARAATGGRK